MMIKRLWMSWRGQLALCLMKWGLMDPGKIMYIGGSEALPTPLNREEEAAVIQRMEQGDKEARQLLIEHNLRLPMGSSE